MAQDARSPNSPTALARTPDDVAAMARAVQANVFQLKVADARRCGLNSAGHALRVPSPGTVAHYRETLIDRRIIQGYGGLEMLLRLHETWGQFCLMRWFFHDAAPAGPFDLTHVPANTPTRCGGELDTKSAEIQAFLWCLRFEQSRRHDPEFTRRAQFAREHALARRIPVVLSGKGAAQCNDEELLVGACEHAGMLAALRWIMDRNCTWGRPGIMDVPENPFA